MTDVGALRDLPVADLVTAQAILETRSRLPFAFAPTVDSVVIDRRALDARAAGVGSDIPMIFGTNADEWRLWAPGDPRARDLDDAGSADAHVRHQPSTFVYRFDWRSPAMGGWLGACHALEIAFVFGVQGRTGIPKFTGSGPDADRVGDRMLATWAAFAHTGDPSTPELEWPAHDPATRPTLVFDAASHLEHAPVDAERAVVAAHSADRLICDAPARNRSTGPRNPSIARGCDGRGSCPCSALTTRSGSSAPPSRPGASPCSSSCTFAWAPR